MTDPGLLQLAHWSARLVSRCTIAVAVLLVVCAWPTDTEGVDESWANVEVVALTDEYGGAAWRFDSATITRGGEVFFIARTGVPGRGTAPPQSELIVRSDGTSRTTLLEKGADLGHQLPVKRILDLMPGLGSTPLAVVVKLRQPNSHTGPHFLASWTNRGWHLSERPLAPATRTIRRSGSLVCAVEQCVELGAPDPITVATPQLCVGDIVDPGYPNVAVASVVDACAWAPGNGLVRVGLRGPGLRRPVEEQAVILCRDSDQSVVCTASTVPFEGAYQLREIWDAGASARGFAVWGVDVAGRRGVLSALDGQDPAFVPLEVQGTYKLVLMDASVWLVGRSEVWAITPKVTCLAGDVDGAVLRLDRSRRLVSQPRVSPGGEAICLVRGPGGDELWQVANTARCLLRSGHRITVGVDDSRTVETIRLGEPGSPFSKESAPLECSDASGRTVAMVEFAASPGRQSKTGGVVLVRDPSGS